MDAFLNRAALLTAILLSLGANYRTTNFVVSTASPGLAKEIGDAAERYRRELAVEWLGHVLPDWPEPCPISVQEGPQLGAGGATSFAFHDRQPYGWTMSIQGSRLRLLDSVLPHEVTHTIFATHFGRPLPRWADEGACTTVEHVSERTKQHHLLIEFLTTGRGIAFNEMFAMKEYPADILPLYSQGYSLARFLIAQGGRRKFLQYVGDGMTHNNWTAATRKDYGYGSLSDLQVTWLEWVRRGSPNSIPTDLARSTAAPAGPGASSQPANAVASREAIASTPATAVASTSGGWYARQRNLARQGVSTTQPSTHSIAAEPPTADASLQSLSRPPGIQQMQPLILEGESGQPAAKGSQNGFYAPGTTGRTVWR